MRKWLIGLAIAGASGLYLAVRGAMRRRKTVEVLESFAEALEKGEVQLEKYRTDITEGHWVDMYSGEADEVDFVFVMRALPDRNGIGYQKRRYVLSWGDAKVMGEEFIASEEESKDFQNLHDLLRRLMHKQSGEQPS